MFGNMITQLEAKLAVEMLKILLSDEILNYIVTVTDATYYKNDFNFNLLVATNEFKVFIGMFVFLFVSSLSSI